MDDRITKAAERPSGLVGANHSGRGHRGTVVRSAVDDAVSASNRPGVGDVAWTQDVERAWTESMDKSPVGTILILHDTALEELGGRERAEMLGWECHYEGGRWMLRKTDLQVLRAALRALLDAVEALIIDALYAVHHWLKRLGL